MKLETDYQTKNAESMQEDFSHSKGHIVLMCYIVRTIVSIGNFSLTFNCLIFFPSINVVLYVCMYVHLRRTLGWKGKEFAF